MRGRGGERDGTGEVRGVCNAWGSGIIFSSTGGGVEAREDGADDEDEDPEEEEESESEFDLEERASSGFWEGEWCLVTQG